MFDSTKNFDVIVVGAGPSGLATAKVLADGGIKILVVERTVSGTRNFQGGIINEESLKSIFPKFSDNTGKVLAPFERVVDQYRAYVLDDNSFTSYNVQNNGQNCYLVLREAFNNWLIKETESVGAKVIRGETVRELITNDEKISGIRTDSSEYFSKVVVLAEGAKSTLAKKTGLRTGELLPGETFIFAEENIQLLPKVIEERFNLLPFNGIAAKLFTQGMFHIPSIGYIYTNHDSILLGVGLLFSDAIKLGLNINFALEKLKEHLCIKPLVLGGKTTNYSSYTLPVHLPEKQSRSVLRLYSSGCLIVGAGASLINLFDWDWSLTSLLSGGAAASVILNAFKQNNFSSQTLSEYEKLLQRDVFPSMLNSRFMQDNDEFKLEVLNNLSSFVLERK